MTTGKQYLVHKARLASDETYRMAHNARRKQLGFAKKRSAIIRARCLVDVAFKEKRLASIRASTNAKRATERVVSYLCVCIECGASFVGTWAQKRRGRSICSTKCRSILMRRLSASGEDNHIFRHGFDTTQMCAVRANITANRRLIKKIEGLIHGNV